MEAIASDYTRASISEAERALLNYAAKLTREPSSCTEADVASLRHSGWSDGAILDATLVTSYFAFVNRIAGGLGVELEEENHG